MFSLVDACSPEPTKGKLASPFSAVVYSPAVFGTGRLLELLSRVLVPLRQYCIWELPLFTVLSLHCCFA